MSTSWPAIDRQSEGLRTIKQEFTILPGMSGQGETQISTSLARYGLNKSRRLGFQYQCPTDDIFYAENIDE